MNKNELNRKESKEMFYVFHSKWHTHHRRCRGAYGAHLQTSPGREEHHSVLTHETYKVSNRFTKTLKTHTLDISYDISIYAVLYIVYK